MHYSRNSRNIGAMRNADLTFELARGQYFRWAASDEVCEPNMLQRLVTELDTRPDVAVCSRSARPIAARSNSTAQNHRLPECERSSPPVVRVTRHAGSSAPLSSGRPSCSATIRRPTPCCCATWPCGPGSNGWKSRSAPSAPIPAASSREDGSPTGRCWSGTSRWSDGLPCPRRTASSCLGAVGRWAAEHWKALARDIAFTG